jgi:hypothetical protein
MKKTGRSILYGEVVGVYFENIRNTHNAWFLDVTASEIKILTGQTLYV